MRGMPDVTRDARPRSGQRLPGKRLPHRLRTLRLTVVGDAVAPPARRWLRSAAVWLSVGLTVAALAGCAAGPDFVPPDPKLPQNAYQDTEPWTTAPPDPLWWAAFHDPVLTRLERRVAADNLDVLTATIRIAESRFQRGVAASALFPMINGDAQYQRELDSINGPFLSPRGPFGPLSTAIGRLLMSQGQPAIAQQPTAFNEFFIGFDASWELDLWGRVRRMVEAADAQVDEASENRRDALVSSLAELARDYIQLRGTQMGIAILVENLKVAEDVMTRAHERAEKGVGASSDFENASAQVEDIRAQIPALESQQAQYVNAIGLLLNQPPGTFSAELLRPQPVPFTPPRVPVGIPSELARRRPDIRAAEANLHAATAEIGVAVASFYPSLTLNGTVGLDSVDLAHLFQLGSLQYMAGPSIKVPIFEGGRLKNMLDLTKAQQQEAVVKYRQTVLRAWHEVVNALVSYRNELKRQAALKREMEHSQLALSIARERYSDGVGDFLTVLDTARTLLQSGQQYVTSTTNVSLDVVQLFKALGGGWEPHFPANRATEKIAVSP